MRGVNIVVLLGRATAAAQFGRLARSRVPIARFPVAINRRIRRPDGSQGEEATYVDCEATGDLAVDVARRAKRGASVLVSGYLRQDRWEKDAGRRNKHRVIIETVEFLEE